MSRLTGGESVPLPEYSQGHDIPWEMTEKFTLEFPMWAQAEERVMAKKIRSLKATWLTPAEPP